MPHRLAETIALSEAAATQAASTGRALIEFITPGWGSSGYYSTEVIEQAATDKVIPKGTHMYADHPTASEDAERPIRSIKDLMAVTTEDAYLSPTGSLVGEVAIVPDWQPLLQTVAEDIGVSIRGSATDIVEGEAEGRRGGIIEGLVAPLFSVDFVTRAGRGGKVLALLESARAVRHAVDEHGITEATASDIRDALSTAVRDAYAGDQTYALVRDFDPTSMVVYFEVETPDGSGLYSQGYTDAGTQLAGDRTEVRIQTSYVPVDTTTETSPPAPAGRTTTESQEDTMPQIEEARLRQLEEASGRLPVLETERDTAIRERDQARAESRSLRNERDARAIIAEHTDVRFTPLEVRGLVADLPLTEAGELDADAFRTTVTGLVEEARTAHARQLEEAGVGRVTSYGTKVETTTKTDAQLREESDRARAGAFGRTVKEA